MRIEVAINFFSGDQLRCHVVLCLSQCHCNYFIKVGRKNLWTIEVGHGTKKVEKHWVRETMRNGFRSTSRLNQAERMTVIKLGKDDSQF